MAGAEETAMRAMGRRLVLLGLVGLAAVAGSAKVGDRFGYGSAELRWTANMAVRLLDLREARGYVGQPKHPPLKTAEERRGLLLKCQQAENDCLDFHTKHPDSLSAFYLWLQARNLTDQVANDVLVDKLDEFPQTIDRDKPFYFDGRTSLDGCIEAARRRALQRDPRFGSMAVPDLGEYDDLEHTTGDFIDSRL